MKKKLSSPSFVFDDRQTVAFNNFEDIGGRKDIYEFIHCQSEEIVSRIEEKDGQTRVRRSVSA
jgi:hypothetical protein